MTERNKFTDEDAAVDHVTNMAAEVDILYLGQFSDPLKGRAALGKLETGVYIAFSHDLKTWKFKVGATEEDALEGKGPDRLLFAANGHYTGPMPDNTYDNVIGMASTLYLLQAKLPTLPPLPTKEKDDAGE